MRMSMANLYFYITMFILFYFAALSLGYTLFLIATFPEILRKYQETEYGNTARLINHDNILPITIIIPAFNEAKRILNTIYSILENEYKNVNIIVVNDGSTDNTLS